MCIDTIILLNLCAMIHWYHNYWHFVTSSTGDRDIVHQFLLLKYTLSFIWMWNNCIPKSHLMHCCYTMKLYHWVQKPPVMLYSSLSDKWFSLCYIYHIYILIDAIVGAITMYWDVNIMYRISRIISHSVSREMNIIEIETFDEWCYYFILLNRCLYIDGLVRNCSILHC